MVRQHIVPKFYLKQFAKKTKNTGIYKIRTYDKVAGKEIRPSIKNIALQNQFYDKTEPPIFEKVLSYLEYHASKVYHKIINNKSSEILTDTERTIFSHFIFTQYTRTKAARELFEQVHDLIYKDYIIREKYPDKKDFHSYPSYLNDRAYLGQLKIMFDPNKDNGQLMNIPIESSKLIFKLKWKLLINRNRIEFYSSDHPIFIYDSDTDGKTIKGYGINTFQKPRVEIYFPLNPGLCLVILGEDTLKYIGEKTELYIERDDLEWINRQLVAEAYQFIFSKNNSFEYVKKVLEYYPELRKVDRNRIYV